MHCGVRHVARLHVCVPCAPAVCVVKLPAGVCAVCLQVGGGAAAAVRKVRVGTQSRAVLERERIFEDRTNKIAV